MQQFLEESKKISREIATLSGEKKTKYCLKWQMP